MTVCHQDMAGSCANLETRYLTYSRIIGSDSGRIAARSCVFDTQKKVGVPADHISPHHLGDSEGWMSLP